MKNISSQYDSSTMLLSKYSPWAYDAAWALAVALNKSMLYLGSNELENFSYNRSDIYDAIKRGMGEVFFQGVSVWSMIINVFKATYVMLNQSHKQVLYTAVR